jgi:hypothetical protein
MSRRVRNNTVEIVFHVPNEYEVPSLYNTSDPESTAHMLTLGAKAYEILKKEGHKLEHDTLYAQLKQQAADEHVPKLKASEDALETIKRRLEQTERSNQDLVESLKRRLQREEQTNQDLERRIREEERNARAELLSEKDKQIADMRDQVSALTKSLREMDRSIQESLFSFKEQILKSSTNSKRKGDHGETVFADYLRRAFGSVVRGEIFDVVKIGSEGHQGDIQMIWHGHKTMWEIKNYSTTVDQKEVSKFHRDMQEAKDVSLGIMVSMTTGIVGHTKPGNIDIEELSDGRICVYLTNFISETQDPVLYLQSLKPFLETFLHYRTTATTSNTQSETSEAKELTERFENHRGLMMRLLKKHEDAMRRFRNTVLNAKKKSESIWLDIMTEMREADANVKLLIETMLELETSESAIPSPSSKTLPNYVFRYNDLALYGQKERRCVEEILRLAEFDDEYTTPKKELREALKDCGYTEETLGKALEQIFTEDAWNKGKIHVKYIKIKGA